jgi:hypothetical protein
MVTVSNIVAKLLIVPSRFTIDLRFNIMTLTKMDREYLINCLEMAIELAGDGGPQPFDDEEYQGMYKLIEELRNENKNTL